MCAQEAICAPRFFGNFSETPCMKVGFDFPRLLSSQNLPLFAGNGPSEPVHMISGQLIASGQLVDAWVNFAYVHGLTSVAVHMNFSLPRGKFERRVTRCTTSGNQPFQGNFSPCEQNEKVGSLLSWVHVSRPSVIQKVKLPNMISQFWLPIQVKV